MPQVAENPRSEGLDMDRLKDILRRRHLQFLIPLFLGWSIVWGASWILPPRYESSTTILVEQPTMPQDYVQPNISDDWQTRLESIKQQILSETRLLMIIQKLHLYAGTNLTDDEKVDQMKGDVGVELDRDPARMNISAFVISYKSGDPQLAQQVTGELSNIFINENTKVRQQESEGTTQFLQQQLDQARNSLSEQDAKVRQFETAHGGTLPDQGASNLQILAGLQSDLQNEQGALNTARQQKAFLQAAIAQDRATASKLRLSAGDGSSAAPVDLATVNQELDRLRGQLDDLSLRYTDQYPDVLVLKNRIAKTEAIRDKLIAASKVKSNDPPKEAASAGDDAELSSTGQQLQSQLQSNQMEITNRENAISELKARIGEYQGRLNGEPATAQQLADLTRGYDQSKSNYDDLLRKDEESQMATSMEKLQQGERFTVLDPPTLPTKPSFPNRLKFCAMGLAAGFALGLLLAGGLEFLDDRMHSGKDIKALLPMAVISEVPAIVTAKDQRKQKRRLVVGWVTTVIVTAAILTGSIFSFLNKS